MRSRFRGVATFATHDFSAHFGSKPNRVGWTFGVTSSSKLTRRGLSAQRLHLRAYSVGAKRLFQDSSSAIQRSLS